MKVDKIYAAWYRNCVSTLIESYNKEENIMFKEADYKRAYEEWYRVSCKYSNEEPVSFEVYMKRVPEETLTDILQALNAGYKPIPII